MKVTYCTSKLINSSLNNPMFCPTFIYIRKALLSVRIIHYAHSNPCLNRLRAVQPASMI